MLLSRVETLLGGLWANPFLGIDVGSGYNRRRFRAMYGFSLVPCWATHKKLLAW